MADDFIPVRRADIEAWRENWLEHNEPEEFGTDIVTPFDHYLYNWPRKAPVPLPEAPPKKAPKVQLSGGPTGYYRVHITHPNQADEPYTAECGDIIEALGMDFNQGCAFKALWRAAASLILDVQKKDYPGVLYDAEKADFYTQRNLIITKAKQK